MSDADPFLDLLSRFHTQLHLAAVAALASGIPVSELWIENQTDRIETRLMRHPSGPGPVGEVSRGEVVARIWLDGTEVRYEGIEIGAGFTARRADA